MHLKQTAFENIVGKRAISPFPTMFSTPSENYFPICPYFIIISLFAAEFEKAKIVLSGKGLNTIQLVNQSAQNVSSVKG